jgi:hypothetical protein
LGVVASQQPEENQISSGFYSSIAGSPELQIQGNYLGDEALACVTTRTANSLYSSVTSSKCHLKRKSRRTILPLVDD